MSVDSPGRFRRVLAKLASSDVQLEAEQLQQACVGVGATPVADLPDRECRVVMGSLRTVTLRPRAGVPALVAELYDGSGTVSLVWLGRRRIPGIDPGRSITATGRVTFPDGRPVIFNPRYELRPSGGPE